MKCKLCDDYAFAFSKCCQAPLCSVHLYTFNGGEGPCHVCDEQKDWCVVCAGADAFYTCATTGRAVCTPHFQEGRCVCELKEEK